MTLAFQDEIYINLDTIYLRKQYKYIYNIILIYTLYYSTVLFIHNIVCDIDKVNKV